MAAAAKGADASDFHFDPPSSLIAGEDLLARIYNAIRNSSAPSGSNHLNTTLLVTFDEHGGTYDHVPPPAAGPPDGKGAAGQMGFTLRPLRCADPDARDLGVDPGANGRQRGAPRYLADRDDARAMEFGRASARRDASARSFAGISSLTEPRAPEDWPEIIPRPVPEMPEAVVPLDAPLGLLGRSLLFSILAMAEDRGTTVPDIKQDDPVTGAEAVAIAHEVLGDYFPNMRD